MQQTQIKPKRAKTPDEALAALTRLCARAEKSTGDARRLMRGWGLCTEDAEQVLARLINDRYIDDSRYADAFAREKLRLSGWGAYKIRAALQRKGIAKTVVDAALAQARPEDMARRLAQMLARKVRTVKHTTPYDLKNKLMRYGLSLGYDFEAVADAVAPFVKNSDPCDDF